RAPHPPGGAQCEEVPAGRHQQAAIRARQKETGFRKMTAPFRIAIAGLGTVGSGVVKALAARGDDLSHRAGRALSLTAMSARDKSRARGFDITGWHKDPANLAYNA